MGKIKQKIRVSKKALLASEPFFSFMPPHESPSCLVTLGLLNILAPQTNSTPQWHYAPQVGLTPSLRTTGVENGEQGGGPRGREGDWVQDWGEDDAGVGNKGGTSKYYKVRCGTEKTHSVNLQVFPRTRTYEGREVFEATVICTIFSPFLVQRFLFLSAFQK